MSLQLFLFPGTRLRLCIVGAAWCGSGCTPVQYHCTLEAVYTLCENKVSPLNDDVVTIGVTELFLDIGSKKYLPGSEIAECSSAIFLIFSEKDILTLK